MICFARSCLWTKMLSSASGAIRLGVKRDRNEVFWVMGGSATLMNATSRRWESQVRSLMITHASPVLRDRKLCNCEFVFVSQTGTGAIVDEFHCLFCFLQILQFLFGARYFRGQFAIQQLQFLFRQIQSFLVAALLYLPSA